MSIVNAKVGSGKYPVIISSNALIDLEAFCEGYARENIAIICDEYFQEGSNSCYQELNRFLSQYNVLHLPGGIESKGLDGYSKAMNWLLDKQLPRDGLIVAIGGGVIGDLTAFIASTYMRGIGLALVPTTTTSMIDSAIGGKTGINFKDQVNAIGTYYNPKAVFMDIRFLLTLNNRDYYAGICEAIKMAITSDAGQARKLMDESNKLSAQNRDVRSLIDLVIWSTKIKLYHVGDDPNEKGIRLVLNYGHTFGQSIETYYGLHQDYYRHGEAVALGMVCSGSAIDAINHNNVSRELKSFTKSILEQYCLPISIKHDASSPIPSLQDLVSNLINDKKRTAQGNRFILVPALGTSIIKVIKDSKILDASFKSILL